jgi:chemotaxis family two-component system response regulator Rcp1
MMTSGRNGTQLQELLERMVPDGARPIEILLVEDNPGDVRIAIEALKDCRVPNNLSVAEDGVEAVCFLRGKDGYAGSPRPDLILLDLNLPRKDGHQVLAEIKTDDGLLQIPVIVLTTSENERDVYRAYDLNANCYVTKPGGLDQLVSVMQSIHYFWSGVAQLTLCELAETRTSSDDDAGQQSH